MDLRELIDATVEYDTVNMTARHSFGENVYAFTDIKSGKVSITRDGHLVRQLSNLTVSEYERALLNTAKEVELLKKFKNGL